MGRVGAGRQLLDRLRHGQSSADPHMHAALHRRLCRREHNDHGMHGGFGRRSALWPIADAGCRRGQLLVGVVGVWRLLGHVRCGVDDAQPHVSGLCRRVQRQCDGGRAVRGGAVPGRLRAGVECVGRMQCELRCWDAVAYPDRRSAVVIQRAALRNCAAGHKSLLHCILCRLRCGVERAERAAVPQQRDVRGRNAARRPLHVPVRSGLCWSQLPVAFARCVLDCRLLTGGAQRWGCVRTRWTGPAACCAPMAARVSPAATAVSRAAAMARATRATTATLVRVDAPRLQSIGVA